MSLLSLSMESQVEGEENVFESNLGGVEQEAQENSESVETELLQVNEQTDRMIRDVETVSRGMDAQDTVEREIAVLESLAANGGLDKNGAVLLNLHVESWNRMYGIPGLFSLGVAVESFGPSNGGAQLSVGLEGVKERASAIWKKLKEIFTNLTRRIKEFFQGLFNGIKKMEFRIKNLREKVNKANFNQAKEPLKNSSYAEKLMFDGDDTVGSIVESARTAEDAITKFKDFSGQSEKILESTFNLAQERIEKGEGKVKYGEKFKEFGYEVKNATVIKEARAKANLPDGKVIGFSLPGNVFLCSVINKDETDAKVNMINAHVKNKSKDINLMSKGECLEVLKISEKIFDAAKALNEFGKKASERREALVDKLEKYFDDKENNAKNDSEKSKVAEAQKSIRDVAKFTQEFLDKPFLLVGKYTMNQLKVYLDLVEKSIYDEKTKKGDGKPAEYVHEVTTSSKEYDGTKLPAPKEDKKD